MKLHIRSPKDESVSGILTVLCNHSFHGSCLTKWVDTRFEDFSAIEVLVKLIFYVLPIRI